MDINTQELRQVALAAPRFDLYAGIHKALRALMADTLLATGRMDVHDDLEFTQTCQRVIELLDFCAGHLRHENQFVHRAMEARASGASAAIAHEHEAHETDIGLLGAEVAQLLAAPVARRAELAHGLYLRLSTFVGHNLEHMHIEETAHNAVLWAHYSDAELVDLHNALVASIPPAEMMYTLRWMVPFMAPAERAGLLADMRQHAPAPAFEAAIETVRPHLTRTEWDKLARALALPA